MNSSLDMRATALVNPQSGIANDYLNHFNEILLMVENLPVLPPDMVDEILGWKPVSYLEYFKKSPLPGSAEASRIYESLDKGFRTDFEAMIELMDRIILASIMVIADHRLPDGSIDPAAISDTCEQCSADIRLVLDRTADLVNHGYAPPFERPQHMADRLMAAHSRHKTIG